MDTTVYEKLLQASIRFVSYRPRSEREIRDFLNQKLKKWQVFGGTVIDKVIARLAELGYVDDAKFAAWWIDQRQTFRPRGQRIIRQELRIKGIDKQLIEDVLAQSVSFAFPTGNANDTIRTEKELALQAVQKKLAAWQRLPLLEKKKKIYAFLGRRGFTSETISCVIDEVTGKE